MTLITIISVLLASVTFTVILVFSRVVLNSKDSKNGTRIQSLEGLATRNEVASALIKLVHEDGAGNWPPRVAHYALPACFQPYQDIYLKIITDISTATPMLDDAANKKRMAEFRGTMAKLLAERVNLSEVRAALERFESGDRAAFPREAYNAVYCCIAVCRHAYRWATIPVVKVAQNETVLELPAELAVPWPYIQRTFGITGEGGNIMVNMVLNFDQHGKIVYGVNVRMSDTIKTAEYRFFRMAFDVEVLAFPIYYEMVLAIVAFEESRKKACLGHIRSITRQVRELLSIFYKNTKESHISRTVWLSYVQGFQGWGIGRVVDGALQKHDGLSANQLLFFQAVDAFLGLGQYLSDESMQRFISGNQRLLCLAIKKHSFRDRLGSNDVALKNELLEIVNHLKLFRSAHRIRARRYLEQPAPERLIMTAGKSVIETPQTQGFDDAYKPLDDMLVAKIQLTV